VTRVLVVEDDPWIAWMIADDLTDRGYEVGTASNGVEALQCLENAPRDVIVLDLMLPTMHGWDFVESYRQKTGGASLPIIVVSAAGAVPRSMDMRGIRCYLRKPFDIEQLAGCVADAAVAHASTAA
jgi:DNA-binding response OmpR family regulator